MKKLWILLLLLIGFVTIAAAVGAGLVYQKCKEGIAAIDRQYYEHRQRGDAELRAHLGAFLRDQELIDSVETFAALPAGSPESGQDAGPYLNPRLPWEGVEGGRAPELVSRELVVPREIQGELEKLGDSWLEKSDGLNLTGISFQWFQELARFGYWEPDLNSVVAERPEIYRQISSVIARPFPQFELLVTWAKLRLIQGKRDLKHLDALREVRHLARLAYTTENLVGSLTSVALIRLVERAFPVYRLNEPRIVEHFRGIPSEKLDGAKRAFFAFPAFLGVEVPQEIRTEVLGKAKAGFCAGLQETLGHALLARPYLGEIWGAEFRRLEELMNSGRCRLPFMKKRWADHRLEQEYLESDQLLLMVSPVDGKPGPIPYIKQLQWVPGIKIALGKLMLSLMPGNGSWFRGYK